MAALTLTPDSFLLVRYDRDELVDVVARTADRVGFPAARPLVVNVIEETPLQRVTITSVEPATIEVEGGAFEDPKRPRQLSVPFVESVMAKALYQVLDRIDGGFADAPGDRALTNTQRSAWHVYAVGRSGRAGFEVQQQRQRYAFRNRHSFTDVADEVFNQLWTAEHLTWTELTALSQRASGS
jgi:hypothetical protein